MKHPALAALVVALLFSVVDSSNVWAQELRTAVQTGDKVRIIDTDGILTQGEIVGLSVNSFRLKVGKTIREWQDAQIREIQKRRKDPWWNGALLGLAIGGGTGYAIGQSGCGRDSESCFYVPAALAPAGMAIGAVAGAFIDFSIKKYDVVFRLKPIVGKGRNGAQLSFSF